MQQPIIGVHVTPSNGSEAVCEQLADTSTMMVITVTNIS
jgi:hypothetical protein